MDPEPEHGRELPCGNPGGNTTVARRLAVRNTHRLTACETHEGEGTIP